MKINTTFSKYFLNIFFLFISFHTSAQFGKDGNRTIATTNTIVNQYTTLQTDVTAGATQIVVTDVTQLSNPTPIGRGDLILIIQMQGATITNTNDFTYGTISNYNGAGNYEYAYVTGTIGNTIQLSCTLAQGYRVAGRTQIVRVPQYQTLTISAGASVTASAWNGTRGGIVAIYAQNIVLDGSINVSNLGFRGGVLENTSANNQANFVSTNANAGGEKGESIAGFQTEYNALGGRFGRGAPANGGGGGNGNNAGGGGGANAGVPADWFRGTGVMCNACTGNSAWTLDPDYIANGNALTNSSGGGRGGHTVSTSNQNALTLAPGGAAWAGDLRRARGGLGGRPLDINAENRIFFGGGGGAGDQNNNAGGRGGNGGGIVYIVSNQITGTGSINANGENGANTVTPHTDAPGGAGGGGTIIIKSNTSVSGITLNARGGNGGNHLGTAAQAHGPGGGGGGGYVAVFTPTDASSKNITGGTNGTTTSTALTEYPTNGATLGKAGISNTNTTSNFILSCNIAPTPQNDAIVTSEDNAVSGNASTNDTDLESLTLSYNAGTFVTVQGGSIVLNADGTFTYTPASNFNGTDSYTYTVCDNGLPTNQCLTATITFTVLPINDVPIAQDDNFSVNEDAVLNGNVSTNDNDGDPETTQTLTFTLQNGGTATTNGTLVLNTDGTFTYTPNANFNGAVSFSYQVCDNGTPSLCATATVNITVNPVNDAPIALDDNFSVNEDAVLNGNISLNDSDGDPETTQTLTFTLQSGGTAITNGTLVLNADGTFTYTPNANFNGVVSFTYQVCDNGTPSLCATATVNIIVSPVNDAPIALDDSFTTAINTVLNNTVTNNDSDIDNPSAQLTYTVLNGGTAVTNGTLVLNADGTFTYTPNTNFSGTVLFTYQLCDLAGACVQATVTILVTSQNPVASIDNFSVDEDKTLTADVSTNDTDPDTPKNQLVFSLTDGGTATTNGVVALNTNGSLTYIPKANFNGVVSFTYKVCDPQNNCSATATVSITVNPINDAPIALDDNANTIQSQNASGSLIANDSDPENDPLTYTSGTFTTENQGKIVIEANGTFVYTPAIGFIGTDCFEYTLCDSKNACSKAKICIQVDASNTLFIPEGFSPNGDGMYDSFVIEGVSGKKVSLKVINRWGNVVYQTDDYKNDWKGIGNMGLHTGENLPDGTYYYVIDLGDGSKPISNYVIIKR
ncbi:MAG: Ig-like domain-containing protein [Raineya sp.]|jgi:gliding motility-associated-like protein|nr:Ig-like domain-containing protein [Raineya sp.]